MTSNPWDLDELQKIWVQLYDAQKALLETLPPDSGMTSPFDLFLRAMLENSDRRFVEKAVIACAYRLQRPNEEGFLKSGDQTNDR